MAFRWISQTKLSTELKSDAQHLFINESEPGSGA